MLEIIYTCTLVLHYYSEYDNGQDLIRAIKGVMMKLSSSMLPSPRSHPVGLPSRKKHT